MTLNNTGNKINVETSYETARALYEFKTRYERDWHIADSLISIDFYNTLNEEIETNIANSLSCI